MSAASAGETGWALFLDFDGTLVDIAERPEAVVVEPGLPELLRALHARLGGALALVTGRTLADLDGFLPGLGIDACGLHGLERRIGGERRDMPGLADLGPEIAALRARLAAYPGVVVESKRVGVAVHWRMAPEAAAEAAEAAADLARRLGPGYHVQDGKAVREIVPAGAGKGGAVRALMAQAPYRGRRPAFVGDDKTDEHGFVAVAEWGGLAVKVGPGESAARHRLAGPGAVRAWLEAWTEQPPPLAPST
ncbi:trehalose-phosphatase [Enterovirga sp.]|uniref:trehalose-phosphatase n=1 Tax=Enterovirga sp. TaxID=2026350 RepID=UPI0026027091|nr:trehalose-phosphatase [Enterovirga sp.]MDB5590195.1 otsB [Enterovirga sp.]